HTGGPAIGARLEPPDGSRHTARPTPVGGRSRGEIIVMDSVRNSFRQQGLVRPRQGRILGGVCAGLGRRFGISAGVARLLFVIILFVLPGSQILVYPVLWILM